MNQEARNELKNLASKKAYDLLTGLKLSKENNQNVGRLDHELELALEKQTQDAEKYDASFEALIEYLDLCGIGSVITKHSTAPWLQERLALYTTEPELNEFTLTLLWQILNHYKARLADGCSAEDS